MLLPVHALNFSKKEIAAMGFTSLQSTFASTTGKVKCIIIANARSDLDKEEISYLRARKSNMNLIALDGMSQKLLKVGITPDFIIGDFDSISWKKVASYFHLLHHQ